MAAIGEVAGVMRGIDSTLTTNIITKILVSPKSYIPYSQLPIEQLTLRVQVALISLQQSFEQDSTKPMMAYLDKVFEARLKSNYDPNVIIRLVDLIAKECIDGVRTALPQNQVLQMLAERRFNLINNQSKLHLANLNLIIAPQERTNPDKELN